MMKIRSNNREKIIKINPMNNDLFDQPLRAALTYMISKNICPPEKNSASALRYLRDRISIPRDMQGRSLVPLLKGQSPNDWRNGIYYHYYEYPSVHMVPRHYGIRTQRYKLMHFYQFGDECEMYDLKNDPDELNNIYGKSEHAKLQKRMKNRLDKLQKHYQDNSDISEKPDSWKTKMRSKK